MIPTGSKPSSQPGRSAAPPATIVIFGAAGDLTKRLLIPSLYNLSESHLLGEDFAVLGVDIADTSTEAWRDGLGETLRSFTGDADAEFHPDRIDAEAWDRLAGCLSYMKGDVTDPACFEALRDQLGDRSAIFYLAVGAHFFAPIVDGLGKAGLLEETEGAFRRLVIEKPFGHDLASAQALNARILKVAREEQVFRIDHFMGKEPVQSLLAMRFANRLFEPIWRAEHVERVEITAAETIGVGSRGRFYEPTGALRDMVPNHMMQLLCMAAMDAPSSLDADAIRGEKTRLLAAVAPLGPDDVVFGQYEAGEIEGNAVPGYREEADVAPDSRTETFVAARFRIHNWRWAGTPFLIRTGKCLAARRTEIVVHLKPAPFRLFPDMEAPAGSSDRITLSVDPGHGIEIAFDVKRPGPDMELAKAATEFSFDEAFAHNPNVGYEALLYDCLTGDATLFQRADTIEAAWRIVDPVLDHAKNAAPLPYDAGSEGPEAAADWGWTPLGKTHDE
ncbi:glucose-6-phosphate 1-dehydrogenase [Palleronia aestuarii]|uniref:Glucose-6-phosphate 1-dehydrogenase n=1 Tax=Palleronia aestuarii TaxID=568105 RepID=A0A2W7NA02_9RHOB|nr:glucose-6-phosphate dehydrogenase [Palleronia aestuarii]PZX17071.1 glucose-6-phosphate 1-dehydrogenase [Palleronia aestuarii]